MHCNEEEKQSIKENHRQRYRTLLSATTSTLHTSIAPNHTREIIPFNMEEQNTGAETTSNYFNMDNQQTGRAIIFPISHYKETSRTTTTNRIKRAHAANKTLYTSTLHTSIVPHRTTIQENRHKKANESPPLCWNLDFRLEITRPPCFSHAPIFLKYFRPTKKRPLQMKERAAPTK